MDSRSKQMSDAEKIEQAVKVMREEQGAPFNSPESIMYGEGIRAGIEWRDQNPKPPAESDEIREILLRKELEIVRLSRELGEVASKLINERADRAKSDPRDAYSKGFEDAKLLIPRANPDPRSAELPDAKLYDEQEIMNAFASALKVEDARGWTTGQQILTELRRKYESGK